MPTQAEDITARMVHQLGIWDIIGNREDLRALQSTIEMAIPQLKYGPQSRGTALYRFVSYEDAFNLDHAVQLIEEIKVRLDC